MAEDANVLRKLVEQELIETENLQRAYEASAKKKTIRQWRLYTGTRRM